MNILNDKIGSLNNFWISGLLNEFKDGYVMIEEMIDGEPFVFSNHHECDGDDFSFKSIQVDNFFDCGAWIQDTLLSIYGDVPYYIQMMVVTDEVVYTHEDNLYQYRSRSPFSYLDRFFTEMEDTMKYSCIIQNHIPYPRNRFTSRYNAVIIDSNVKVEEYFDEDVSIFKNKYLKIPLNEPDIFWIFLRWFEKCASKLIYFQGVVLTFIDGHGKVKKFKLETQNYLKLKEQTNV